MMIPPSQAPSRSTIVYILPFPSITLASDNTYTHSSTSYIESVYYTHVTRLCFGLFLSFRNHSSEPFLLGWIDQFVVVNSSRYKFFRSCSNKCLSGSNRRWWLESTGIVVVVVLVAKTVAALSHKPS